MVWECGPLGFAEEPDTAGVASEAAGGPVSACAPVWSPAVAYGPFPEVAEAEEWLFQLGIFIDAVPARAWSGLVHPAYELHPPARPADPHAASQRTAGQGAGEWAAPAAPSAAPMPWTGQLAHSGLSADERAYGFIASLQTADSARRAGTAGTASAGMAGVFATRAAVVAWWNAQQNRPTPAQAGGHSGPGGGGGVRLVWVLPLLPVPRSIDGLLPGGISFWPTADGRPEAGGREQ